MPLTQITTTTVAGSGTLNGGADSYSVNVTSVTTIKSNGAVTESYSGSVTFSDPAHGVSLTSTKITGISLSTDGTQATITGTAKVGKIAVTFQVIVTIVSGPTPSETFDLSYVGGGKTYDSGLATADNGAPITVATTMVTEKSVNTDGTVAA